MVRAIGVKSGIHDGKLLMAALRSFTGKGKVFAQAFDPHAVISERQLLLAHKLAKDAFAEKRNIAKTLEVEVLVRAAATRKIADAIAKAGAKNGEFILLTDAEGKKLGGLLNAVNGKQMAPKFLWKGLGARAGYSAEDLVLEKMAMLEAEK